MSELGGNINSYLVEIEKKKNNSTLVTRETLYINHTNLPKSLFIKLVDKIL